MLSHRTFRDRLEAYSDGTLDDAGRVAVASHLETCAECARAVGQFRRLDDVLRRLPTAPVLPAFPRFWSRLESALPKAQPAPFVSGRRLALGFAVAAIASMAGVVALASNSVLPDDPRYPIKQLREEGQLVLAFDQRARLDLQIGLAAERAHEAQAMVTKGNERLALRSLADFRSLVKAAAPALDHPATAADRAGREQAVAWLRSQLEAVQQANVDHGQSAAVEAAVEEGLEDLAMAAPQSGIPAATPSASASPAPQASAAPSARPSAQPTPSSTVQPSAVATPQASASPSPSASASPGPSPDHSASPSPSATPSASASPSPSR